MPKQDLLSLFTVTMIRISERLSFQPIVNRRMNRRTYIKVKYEEKKRESFEANRMSSTWNLDRQPRK